TEGRLRVQRDGWDLGEVAVASGVGALSILARDQQGIEAVAVTDVVTLELHADAFLEVLEDNFTIMAHLLQEVARELVDLMVRTPEILRPVSMQPVTGVKSGLNLVERIFFLRQAAPFARSSINALAELARGMAELRFDPGV